MENQPTFSKTTKETEKKPSKDKWIYLMNGHTRHFVQQVQKYHLTWPRPSSLSPFTSFVLPVGCCCYCHHHLSFLISFLPSDRFSYTPGQHQTYYIVQHNLKRHILLLVLPKWWDYRRVLSSLGFCSFLVFLFRYILNSFLFSHKLIDMRHL